MTVPTPSLVHVLGLEAGRHVVCAVGAGGKKTLLYRLARELPGRIALTSTVHTPPYIRHVDAVIVEDDPLRRLREDAFDVRVLGLARPSEKHNRWAGLAPEAVDRLAALDRFDFILVKADGARFRWIKAPSEDEPVVPSSATVVLWLVSARAIGASLDAEAAHHPEAVARLSGARIGEPIEPRHLAALFTHPEGGLKGVGRARVVPIVNMVEAEETRAAALDAARAMLARSDRFDRVVLTALTAEEPVIAVVRG